MGFKLKNLQRLINELKSINYTCKDGCYECCTGITFLPIEEKRMKKELRKNGYLEPPQGKGKEYCEYLDKNGKCSVYSARPMVCRFFGNTGFRLKNPSGKDIVTPVCNYAGTALIIPATKLFIDYGMENLNNGKLNKCGEYLLKIPKEEDFLENSKTNFKFY